MTFKKNSLFSDLHWRYYTGHTHRTKTHYDDFNEVFESNCHTRSDISNLDSTKKIVGIFGDSFMYGHGLPKNEALEVKLKKHYSDIEFVNFAIPGSSNQHSLYTLEQWLNSEYSEKTSAILFGFTEPTRRFIQYNREHVNMGIGKNPKDSSLYDSSITDINSINPTYYTNKNAFLDNAHYDYYTKEWKHNYHHSLSPRQCLYDLELTLKRLYWISKGLDIPVVYYLRNSFYDWMNANDINILKTDMNNIAAKTNNKMNFIDLDPHEYRLAEECTLPCGHWNSDGMEFISELFNDKLKDFLYV